MEDGSGKQMAECKRLDKSCRFPRDASSELNSVEDGFVDIGCENSDSRT